MKSTTTTLEMFHDVTGRLAMNHSHGVQVTLGQVLMTFKVLVADGVAFLSLALVLQFPSLAFNNAERNASNNIILNH
jgi:hypothetical protein